MEIIVSLESELLAEFFSDLEQLAANYRRRIGGGTRSDTPEGKRLRMLRKVRDAKGATKKEFYKFGEESNIGHQGLGGYFRKQEKNLGPETALLMYEGEKIVITDVGRDAIEALEGKLGNG